MPRRRPPEPAAARCRTPADLVAWAILINHYHLLLRVRDAEHGTPFLRSNTVLARRERRRGRGLLAAHDWTIDDVRGRTATH